MKTDPLKHCVVKKFKEIVIIMCNKRLMRIKKEKKKKEKKLSPIEKLVIWCENRFLETVISMTIIIFFLINLNKLVNIYV